MSGRICFGPIRLATSLAVVALAFVFTPATFGFTVGDRVEVKRGLEWARGTVTAFDGSRNRYTVRLDDDGSHANLTPEQREKRLTRNYFPSEMREVRGADTPPPVADAPSPSTPPAMQGSTVTIPPDAVGPRTWSDKSGRFKVEATYRGMNGAKVVLEKTDGTKIEVELAKLSEADNVYVEGLSAAAENPFDVPPVTSRGSRQPVPTGSADHKGMRIITPQRFREWSFKPESRAIPPTTVTGQSIELSELPNRGTFGDRIQDVSVSLDGKRALVARTMRNRGDEVCYIEDFDLENGKSLGTAALPPDRELKGMDATFGIVVWKSDVFSDTPNSMGAGRIDQGQLASFGEFEPHFPDKRPGDSFGRFNDVWVVGPQHVMVGGTFSKSLIIWDVRERKAVWSIPVGNLSGHGKVSVSPDSHYVALNTDQGIAIIDLQSGTHVATLTPSVADNNVWKTGFSNDNNRLVVQGFDDATVYDLTTGKQLHHFRHALLSPTAPLTFVGEFLIQQGTYVFDPYHRVLLWEIGGHSTFRGTSILKGGAIVVVEPPRFRDEGSGRLYSSPIPLSEMVELAKSLGDPESLVIARPGDKVAIDLEIDPAVANEDDIYRKMVIAVEKVGFEVVVDEVPLVLKGFCKSIAPQTIRINTSGDVHRRHFPRPEDIVERTITPHPTYVSLSYRGKEIWRRGTSGRPGMDIYLQQGEGLDQALQRITSPQITLFENLSIELPLIKPGEATANGAYGASEIEGDDASF